MLRHALAALFVGVALVAAGPAGAQDYARSGPYAGLGGMLAFFGDGRFSGTGGGISGRVGYRLFSHLAVEVQSEYTPKRDVWSLIGQLKIPLLTGVFQPYLQGGPGVLGSKAQNVDPGGRIGGGADLYLSENLVLYADLAYLIGSDSVRRADYLSLGAGLQWRF